MGNGSVVSRALQGVKISGMLLPLRGAEQYA
jgi:hypothetical protein